MLKNKKSVLILKKEGFELLSQFHLLKQPAGKYSAYYADFRLIMQKTSNGLV